jgi:hypothetical protein
MILKLQRLEGPCNTPSQKNAHICTKRWKSQPISIANIPICKQNDELIRLLCIENIPFFEKITVLYFFMQDGK